MKQYIEHDGMKRAFVIKQVERRSFQEIDKAEETDSTIDCPSLIKDELKEFRIRKAQKNKNFSSYISKHSQCSMNPIDVNCQVHHRNQR